MASRLTNILQQEYKTKGLIGGAVSALGKSSREKTDIRNIIFGGSGLGSIVGRKVFGKGYSATDRSGKTSEMSSSISGSSSVLQEISISSKIAAKNSMSLPMMARDMNVMRQGIVKLVKLQGGTQRDKADRFFMSASDREKSYEAQFNKSGKSKTPSIVGKEKEKGSGGILGLVASLFVGLAATLGSFGAIVTGLVGTFVTLGTLLMGTVSLIMRLVSALPGGKLLIKGLKIGALAVGGLFAANALGKSNNQSPNSVDNGDSGNSNTLVNTAAGIGGAIAGVSTIKAGSKLVTAGKATSAAILDAKTIPSNLSYKGQTPTDKWGKFLQFLEKKAPKLFSKIGVRLATAGALMAIPIVGWVAGLIQLGFSLYAAYEIYTFWKEFTSAEGAESSSSPTPASLPKAGTPEAISKVSSLGGQEQTYDTMGGGEFGADMIAATGVNADMVTNTPTSPTRTDGGDMANLIRSKFKAAGFSDAQAEGAVANARAESGLNPNAHNTKGEDSVGLFQMNRKGGLGVNEKTKEPYSVAQLKDPNFNIDLAIKAAKNSPKFKSATTAEEATKAFMLEVERPKDQSASAQAKRVAYLNNTGNKIGSASTALASANSPSTGGTSVTDNKIINNNTQTTSSGGGTQVSAYDSDLVKYLLRPVT